jgi:flagellar hook-length control protein FliK
VGDGKSGILPSASPESTLQMLEALAERSTQLAQTSTPHAADGSALATTSVLSRVGETQVTSGPAAPLAPAAPPQAQVAQVEGSLRWMLKSGTQEAELQLHPDSLGQVTIHLRVEGGEVHARLWITEPASMQAVQEGRPHLEMALKEQGLQLGSFDLQQGHRPFQEAPSAPSFREPSFQEEAAPTRQEAPAPPSTGFLNSHHVELYA